MSRPLPALDAILSPRELEIVELVAQGKSNADICRTLNLRPQTVKNRLSEIYDKTGARNRVELAVFALRPRK